MRKGHRAQLRRRLARKRRLLPATLLAIDYEAERGFVRLAVGGEVLNVALPNLWRGWYGSTT